MIPSQGTLKLDKKYRYVLSIKKESSDPETVHIVIPAHNFPEMTDVAVQCIKKYTEEPYIIWIVDDNSNEETRNYLMNLDKVNVIFNKTGIGSWYYPKWMMKKRGSEANAISLNMASKIITGKYMFVMHSDALPVRAGWLDFLKSKLNDKIKIVGVSTDHIRVKAVHVSGFLFDFQLYNELDLSFSHNMPIYDAGDMITIGLVGSGYGTFVCKNTSNNPETIDYINNNSHPDFIKAPGIDRIFDDNNNLIYMHLGRGTAGRKGDDRGKPGYLKRSEWVENVKKYYLQSQI